MKLNQKIVYFIGFLFSIPVALTSYINSSFLESFIGTNKTSMLYIAASFLTIISMTKMERILSFFGNRKTSNILSLIAFSSFLVMALSKDVYTIITFFIVNFISINLMFASLDIFIEDFSKKNSIGKLRGFYLTIINSAWIIAQLISSTIINKSSFTGIYLISSLFMLLVSVVSIFSFSNFKDPKYKKTSLISGIKFFINNKNLGRIYLTNLILRFFFAWMVIYTPIYLHEYLKFNWSQIGIVFSVMLIPFLGQYNLGKISDRIGEKKILKLGFLIGAISTFCIPFINSNSVFLVAGIMFMTRVGAAAIEVMSENYFFKSVPEENVGALEFFRNAGPISFIIAPLVAVPIFLFIPSFQYIFYILSAILFTGFFIASRLKDVR